TDGYCKGKGGSMHIADFDSGILGANGIVGGGISLATGAAFTCKYLQNERVAVCFFGDGAINQGVFYESANMAAMWKLPVIYVCERNQFQQVSYSEDYYPDQDLTKRTEPFGFRGIEVDGNNVLEVYEKTCEIVKRVRKGEGPAFIVANTYRIYGHHMGDPVSYRRPGELEIWKDERHDPIMRMKNHLIKEEILSIQELESITKSIDESIINTVKYAEESPLPEPESLMKDIYSN
ncbi:MAG: pyruvate dehydrogenase (acetyl-transferring) E1 component subunit alpha, partial [Chloroflexi bacterium]|nr:pyruvate dehydrogenase (acetyl-transferring) E1 component subunit alpha [Chloroflexota bacterium]